MEPLTPAVFHILLALIEGEKHGYGIMQEVRASTDGKFTMGPGTLYGTIKRLLDAGLVEESDDRPDPNLSSERRRYYRITSRGRIVAKSEAERIHRLARSSVLKSLLKRPKTA